MEDKKKEKEEIEEIFEELKDGEQDEEKLSKFFQQLEKKISKRKGNNRIAYMFGFLISPNILVHFLATLLLNFGIMFSIQGFFNLAQYNHLGTFALAIALFTLAEFVTKVFVIRYLMKLVLACAGIVFIGFIFVYFILLGLFLPNFEFETQSKLIIFILVFWLIRYIISRLMIAYVANKINSKYMRKEN